MSAGGVFLPESAKERPMAGVVVRTGPGKMEEDGVTRKAPCVAEGDQARAPARTHDPACPSLAFPPPKPLPLSSASSAPWTGPGRP